MSTSFSNSSGERVTSPIDISQSNERRASLVKNPDPFGLFPFLFPDFRDSLIRGFFELSFHHAGRRMDIPACLRTGTASARNWWTIPDSRVFPAGARRLRDSRIGGKICPALKRSVSICSWGFSNR